VLESGRFDARLDYQWGAAGEYWRIAATASPSYAQQFESLARIAGTKIVSVPTLGADERVAQEADPVRRWYRCLVLHSGRFEQRTFATQVDEDGNPAGNIYSGSIPALSDVSANLCLMMESICAAAVPVAGSLLELPRYAGPMTHWREATRLRTLEDPDLRGAVHEAISSVEGLVRLILADEQITLGKAVDALRQKKHLHPAIAKCLDGLWGYSSSVPGVRHGASSPVSLSPREAVFVLDTCQAAIGLLVAIDSEPT